VRLSIDQGAGTGLDFGGFSRRPELGLSRSSGREQCRGLLPLIWLEHAGKERLRAFAGRTELETGQ